MGWLPGLSQEETKDLTIRTCVLSSHRLFSGMNIDGVPVRDIHSLRVVTEKGEVGSSFVVPGEESTMIRYSLWEGDSFCSEELDDYLSDNSKYFGLFQKQMVRVGRLTSLVEDRVELGTTT